MNKKIGMKLGAVGLAGLLAIGCDSKVETGQKQQTSDANYYPGTIHGRSPPATAKEVELSKLTEHDLGSYVLAEYNDNNFKDGRLIHSDNSKVIVYSSRIEAMKSLFNRREQYPGKKFDLIQITNENYLVYKQTGSLNGLH